MTSPADSSTEPRSDRPSVLARRFEAAPHRTLLGLSLPVLLSLLAEPLTGLVDTAFVSRLGAVPLAALGVATILLSSAFWIFNFLGIGTQTEVSRSFGSADESTARRAWGLALAVALGCGCATTLVGWIGANPLVGWMGAEGPMAEAAVEYLHIRLLGAPFLLATAVAFGALRGTQEMRLPMWIALGVNGANIVLDAVLILGWGLIPGFGIAGAAWATTVSQAVGGLVAVELTSRRLGRPLGGSWREVFNLLVVGRDLFLRTGFLILFLAVATRAATEIGAASGAAHQAVRQVWLMTALALDALAITAQSLAGFYLGSERWSLARRVAGVACSWGLAIGTLIGVAMLLGTEAVVWALVPAEARPAFDGAWWIAAAVQPFNAVTFVTDGLHWAARDYAYLRNAVFVATVLAGAVVLWLPHDPDRGLAWVWLATAGWICVRALFGLVRIWPGVGERSWR